MADHRYENHRTAALAAAGEAKVGTVDEPDLWMKLAHVEAMIYVGDQVNRLVSLIENEIEKDAL